MARISEYERLQIESLLLDGRLPVDSGIGLFLMPRGVEYRRIFDIAVGPAMQKNGLNPQGAEIAFDSFSTLSEVHRAIQRAEVIVADVSEWGSDLAYVLGLCHGLRRCPILISAEPLDLPFNLMALRAVEYKDRFEDLAELRENLARAIRVFLAAARASGDASAP